MIAHQVTVARCQVRQREHFHKCPICTHYNARDIVVPSLDKAVVSASTERAPGG